MVLKIKEVVYVILAILQARMNSTRLPGKVLKPLLGIPMLQRQIERIKRSKMIDKLIVATSDQDSDNPIRFLCENNGIPVFRGSLDDVLDRFYQCALSNAPNHIVRLTGDCPLADPLLIDEIISYHLTEKNDYTSNTLEPTYPDGLDVEVFCFSVLKTTWIESELPSEREHVTPYIYKQPDKFKLGSFKNNTDLSHLRWTVDEEVDYEFVQKVYTKLYPDNPTFGTLDLLAYIERDQGLIDLNGHFKRNEGYFKSLQKDN